MAGAARWTWRDSPSPREIIPELRDVQAQWIAWVSEVPYSNHEEIRDRHGNGSGYYRSRDMVRYAKESERAHREDSIESSSKVAQGFWIAMQERFVFDREGSTAAMDPEVADAFRIWNISAGRREIDGLVLPWLPETVEMIVDGTLGRRGTENVKKALRVDLGHFMAYRRIMKQDDVDTMPSVLPADLDAPVAINDPRVRHLWVEAAEVSRETGMCSTYDVMARKVGVPNRVELRASGELQQFARLSLRLSLNHRAVGAAAAKDPNGAFNALTGADLRAIVDRMTDDELKTAFQLYDYKIVE